MMCNHPIVQKKGNYVLFNQVYNKIKEAVEQVKTPLKRPFLCLTSSLHCFQ